MDNKENPTTPAYSSSNASLPGEELEESIPFPQIELFVQHPESQDEDLLLHGSGGNLKLCRPSNLDGKAFLRVAQLLADQIIMQNHELTFASQLQITGLPSMLPETPRSIDDPLSPILSRTLPGVVHCNLRQFSEIGQKSTTQQENEMANLQNAAKQSSIFRQLKGVVDEPNRIFHIKAPFACIRRGGAPIDLAISALKFWEELSLAPISGAKDVAAVCVVPASSFIQERVLSFLSAIGSAYQSSKLGMHKPCLDVDEVNTCLVPVAMGIDNLDKEVYEIGEACEKLGKSISASHLVIRSQHEL